jgi:hypothetical protein
MVSRPRIAINQLPAYYWYLRIGRNLLYHRTLRLQVAFPWIGLPDDPNSQD